MRQGFTDSVIEEAAHAWLERLSRTVKYGPEIAPGELAAERSDFGQVVLTQRLQDALARLNPTFSAEALEDAFSSVLKSRRWSRITAPSTTHSLTASLRCIAIQWR